MDSSVLIFLGIALSLVVLLKKARIGSIIAFLLAGVIAGPQGLGFFHASGAWNYLGELGIMFLWFTLGLELNFKRLWSMRKNIFGFGAAQVLAAAAFMFPILFGFTDWTAMGAAMVCLMLAMSNSGADLQTLADRNELQSRLGRQAFSILLFQDLLTIPILAMLPVFAGRSFNLGAEIIDVGVLTVGLVLGVVIFARVVMNPVMKIVAKTKSREAFLLVVLLNITICAAAFHFVGMPGAIGAFLAGMLFSETVYNHQVRADIAPYQMLFITLFFIALGIGLDLRLLYRNIWLVAGGACGLMLLKFSAIYIVARIRRLRGREAFLIALLLAQGGEFGLLILQTVGKAGIEAIPIPHAEIVTAAIIVSMILTPIILWLYDKMGERGLLYSQTLARKYSGAVQKKPDVVICGFGRVGMTIAKMLAAKSIPYIAIDMNVDGVVRGREAGFNVVYGDTTRGDVLSEFGLAPRTTRAVIVALDNAAVAKKTVRAVRRIAARVRIFARARNLVESKILLGEGARVALPETIESSFLLGHGVLAEMGVSERDIRGILSKMRRDNYADIDGILN
ncbi:MAG: cation:proton antiporter [Rickettsiales bacterium]|jgi:Kef-type K+ transport system membrane component KefB/voltage-gated potassium channel Kch|nr:cation:proton antiporter [Rickettsiales bacterium]